MDIFKIEIANEQQKTYNIFTFVMLTLNFLGFGYAFLRTSYTTSMFAIIGLVLNASPWIYYLINKKHFKTPIVEIVLMVTALLWFYFGNLWVAVMLLIFSIIGIFTNNKKIIIFSESEIVFPSFPIKKYAWQEVEQTIWKDDTISINFKNNNLIQFCVSKEYSQNFNVSAFNEFCANNILNNTN